VGLSIAVAFVAVVATWLATRNPTPTAAAEPRHSTPSAPDGSSDARWRRVLDRLDGLRSRAWRRGDPDDLSEVNVAGSAALRADRAMLAAYWSRGLRLRARLDFLRVRLVERRPDEATLDVVDRLRPAAATSVSGAVVDLPADQATAHTIVLRRVGGRWLIADVAG
jgi:hypothetical protein